MALTEYRRKRNARRTPEPMPRARGKRRAARGGRLFVVQKHAASHLHYDFRLELEGVLKSWAVPKGPSLDPGEKRLAMQVEDHPIEYADFEGIIPEGEYGAGTVMVWDHGQWEPVGDARESYEQGRMKLRLNGEKLRGGWALVRMHGRAASAEGRQWLLIKERDAEARPAEEFEVTRELPNSALTGRSIEQIAAESGEVWESNRVVKRPKKRSAPRKTKAVTRSKSARRSPRARQPLDPASLSNARRAAMPGVIHPQLATLVKAPPAGDDWRHEIKYDGYRIVCFLAKGRARLITRHSKNWTSKFARVAGAAAGLPVDSAVLDGEVVVLNPDGTTNFQALQNALKAGRGANLVYFVFDLPYCQGYDLSRTPLAERKQLLKELLAQRGKDADVLRYSDDIQGRGAAVFREACRHRMEGIVSKRGDSPYEQRRTRSWLKIKCISRQEFVVVGYTDPSGARTAFGALLLGYYDKRGRLIYCGRVGTGFDEASLRQIYALLKKRAQSRPAVSNPRGREARGVHWVRPELVAEVEFTEWTREGILRHPSFLGLREDKKAREVVREMPEAAPAAPAEGAQTEGATTRGSPKRPRAGRRSGATVRSGTAARAGARGGADELVIGGVRITHADRILYAEQQVTKAELAEYYTRVADWILPHLVHRPLAVVRCPQGRAKKCFYQKHVSEALPDTIHGITIREKNQPRGEPAAVEIGVSDLAGLINLVQFGVLEIHPWGAREDNVERPDRLYFDLDPGKEVAWEQVVQAAHEMRALLADLGLESFVKTSGGKGLHVAVPIARRSGWEEAREFTRAVAERMARAAPQRYLATMSKARRRGRIFVDYLRNARGATAVAPYSTRARAGAPVSAPLAWEELTPRTGPAMYTVQNIPERLAKAKRDPWERFFQTRQTLSARVRSKLGM